VLGGGDVLLPSASHAPNTPPLDAGEVERRARLLLGSFARMGVTALTPGERDLAVGPALLRRLVKQARVPMLSANLVDGQGKLVFDADRLVDAAGTRVGIFGVTRALPEDEALWKAWKIEARDPAAAARAEIASLRARGAALVIGLVHAGQISDAKRLVDEAPGIDWAVLGHSGNMYATPETAGSTRLLEAMTQGKEVGRLDLHVVDGATRFVDRGGRAQTETILADHRHQLDDYRKRIAETKDRSLSEYYAQHIAELDKAVARETALLGTLPRTVAGSWFDNRIMPLEASVPDHPGVAMLVAAYNRENERRTAAGQPVGVGTPRHGPAVPPPPGPPAPITYAGTVACGSCHQPALKFWQATKHARALEALAKVKRDRDATCVGCHVTGFLQPGGTSDIAVATARLREVGCEACHGPGVTHLTAVDGAPKRASIKRQVPASVCLGCHTRDQTGGDFDYVTFMKGIVGPGHGG